MYIKQWFSELPFITKGLFFIYLITGIIATYWPSYDIDVYFRNSTSIYTRLISYLYFGDILSVSYWYELVLFVIYSKSLEYEYINLNNQKKYFICLLFGIVMILFLSILKPLQTFLLSESFVFYIIFLYNNYKNPNGTTVFIPALFVDNRYMIILLIFVNAIFRSFYWTEYFIGITAGYIFMKLEQAKII
ncbi:unnamed protein product [Adineta steineri]|uniref:Derlin n=1 Tax=Adineta steineri TaxID=433720 RepID=A0A814Q3H2_9BILA|nr:unnamed protein product [Adineta steineri]CAF1177734.1 unnamed protein product [Adineta steineri]